MKHAPREHQRVYITFYLRVFEVDTDEFIGFLIDFSEDGIMIMSEFPLHENKFYQMKMKLPSSLEWKGKKDKDKYITFTAECRWTKHDDVDKEFYLSGFLFTELGEEERNILKELIDHYRIK